MTNDFEKNLEDLDESTDLSSEMENLEQIYVLENSDDDMPSAEEVMAEIEEILGDDLEQYTIAMEDAETGEEYTFYMVDNFEYNEEIYAVLVSVDNEPEAVFAKVVNDEDGTMNFMTIVDEEYNDVASYYEDLVAEEDMEF